MSEHNKFSSKRSGLNTNPSSSRHPSISNTSSYSSNNMYGNGKSKSWFNSGERSTTGASLTSSWINDTRSWKMPGGGDQISVIEGEITDDFWESDFSDDFLNQIMNEACFENKLKTKPPVNPSVNKPVDDSPKKIDSKPPIKKLEKPPYNKTLNTSSFRRVNSSDSQRSDITLTQNYPTSQLKEGQRKLIKPCKSLTLPSNSQALTTEWLRSQLEKLNKECSTLKESITTKEGESKILREKLNEAKITIEKQKVDKEMECLNIKNDLEQQIKSLKKELELAKTQIIFKSKEAQSNIERYKELKNVNVIEPSCSQMMPSTSKSFKKFMSKNEKTLRASFPCTSDFFEDSQSTKWPAKAKESRNTFTQTHFSSLERIDTLIEGKEFSGINMGRRLTEQVYPSLFQKAEPELSMVIPPEADYYPMNVLFRDSTEYPDFDGDFIGINLKLKEIWKVVDGEEDEERRVVKRIPRGRHFSSLDKVYLQILELCESPSWTSLNKILFIIQYVTKMARELFMSLHDKYTVDEDSLQKREDKVIEECQNKLELENDFDILSSQKWRHEVFVDLRRGLALISIICEIFPKIGFIILEESHMLSEKIIRPINDETFSTEEISEMSCTTDTFTNDGILPVTYIHSKALELHYLNIKEILMEKQNKFKDGPYVIRHTHKESPSSGNSSSIKDVKKKIIDLSSSVLLSLQNSKLGGTESKSILSDPKSESMDIECVHTNSDEILHAYLETLEPKINESWNKVVESRDKIRVIDTDVEENEIDEKIDYCFVDTMVNKREKKLKLSASKDVSPKPAGSSEKTYMSLNSGKCVSIEEKNLLCKTFNNFLQIKDKMLGKEISNNEESIYDCCTQPTPSVNYEEATQVIVEKTSRKRKMDDLSKMSEAGPSSKRRGVPLLKNQRQEIEIKASTSKSDMDTQDIENEVDKIFERKISEKPVEVKENLEVTMALPHMPPRLHIRPEEIAAECELIDILLECIKKIRKLTFSVYFNALFASILNLLRSLLKSSIPSSLTFREEKIIAVIVEMLYCRPSALVVLHTNIFLDECLRIYSFAHLICFNAHPSKFCIKKDQIHFKRGACLISTLCTLINLSLGETHWRIQYHFIRWVAYLFLIEKNTVLSLYQKQRTTSGRCSCVRSFNVTIVNVLAFIAGLYCKYFFEENLSPSMKLYLTETISHGIRILSIIVDKDKFFAQNIISNYNAFTLFLETVKCLSDPSKDYYIELGKSEMKIVKLLLDEEVLAKKLKQKPTRETDLTKLSKMFSKSKQLHWHSVLLDNS